MEKELQAVLKITAYKDQTSIKTEYRKKVLQTKDIYKVSSNPFYKFIYDEIEKLREEN